MVGLQQLTSLKQKFKEGTKSTPFFHDPSHSLRTKFERLFRGSPEQMYEYEVDFQKEYGGMES